MIVAFLFNSAHMFARKPAQMVPSCNDFKCHFGSFLLLKCKVLGYWKIIGCLVLNFSTTGI